MSRSFKSTLSLTEIESRVVPSAAFPSLTQVAVWPGAATASVIPPAQPLAAMGAGAPAATNAASADEPEKPAPTADSLTWDDYEQVEKRREYGALTKYEYTVEASAYKYLGMITKKNVDGTVDATATVKPGDIPKLTASVEFDRKGSYVWKPNVGDKVLLEHERLHLRIAEYIVKKANANAPDLSKLSAKVTGVKADDVEEEMNKAFDTLIKAERDKFLGTIGKISKAVQEDYDKQTEHGTKPTEQKDWESKYEKFVDAAAKANGWTK